MQTLAALARTTISTHDRARALGLILEAETIDLSKQYDYNNIAKALTRLAGAAAFVGDHELARAIAWRTTEMVAKLYGSAERGVAIERLVLELHANGMPDDAVTLALSIEHLTRRTLALTSLALRDDRRGPRLTALAFGYGDWIRPLDALARYEPSGLPTIAAHLRVLATSQLTN